MKISQLISLHKSSPSSPPANTFSSTLPQSATTSAGVYSADGVLIRTLWSGKQYVAGTHVELWDGKDDAGNSSTDISSHHIELVQNNVQHEWGVIGNSSYVPGNGTRGGWNGGENIYDMAIHGNVAYVSKATEEAGASRRKFNLSNPQAVNTILFTGQGSVQRTEQVVTDGVRVYWVVKSPGTDFYNFVNATNISNDGEYIFSNGSAYTPTISYPYSSVIALDTNNSSRSISGIAVQKIGQYLFLSYRALNEIHVYDKVSGEFVRVISIQSPHRMCVDATDNLWIISETITVAKYTVNTNGTITTPLLSLLGLVEPLAVGVSPDGTKVAVVDGGSSQQVKFYDASSGVSTTVLGQAGGYATDATVQHDKFMFGGYAAYITFAPDGSYWVGDIGNARSQHFSSSHTYIDNIMFIGTAYSAWTDPNNPTRVFGKMYEYTRDYSKSIAAHNNSWTLSKNWSYGLGSEYDDGFYFMRYVSTLSNGKTYTLLRNKNSIGQECFELVNGGNLRSTGIFLHLEYEMKPDGSLVKQSASGTFTENYDARWTTRPLVSFSLDNPVWGTEEQTEIKTGITSHDPVWRGGHGYRAAQKTDSGAMLSFNAGNEDISYHLGAVKNNTWVWKSARSTHREYKGPYPNDGSYDIGNEVYVYAGGVALTKDHLVFQNYHGEFWKAGQTNIHNIFYENGLFLAQFGNSKDSYRPGSPEMAGNAFSTTVSKVGNDYVIHHNDESYNGGVHEFRITNTESIQVQTIPIFTSSNYTIATLPYVDLMTSLPFNDVVTSTNAPGWSVTPNVTDRSESSDWSVVTSIETYTKSHGSDIMIRSNSGNGQVTRDLGQHSNLTNWILEGKIVHLQQPNNFGFCYLRVVDDSNKIIAQFEYYTDTYATFDVKGNNTHIAGGTPVDFGFIARQQQLLRISGSSAGIVFEYANYSSVLTPLFDNSANYRNPKQLQIVCIGGNYGRWTGLIEFKLYKNQ